MNNIVLDNDTCSQLASLSQADLYDPTGKKIGYFISRDVYRDLLIASAPAEISEEELERRSREETGRPLADILRDLENKHP
jgi:hypothetical protein